ncbi:hypothetical protein KY289_016202 [Solanum tuberosum]|nr:hypothetical protein KY289_016202 [Solanum tuberosum]
MDKGDVEMLDVETNVPASDVLVSNDSPIKYENGVKTSKSNDEDKTHDQSDSKGEDSKNARSETEDQLNSKSQPEAHDNVVLENKTPTIDAGTDDMVSGYVKVTDDEVQNIDEGEVNDVHQSEKMIYEVGRVSESDIEVTDFSIGKAPEPASPMFLINPATANAGQHSGEASENISAMMADGEDDECSPEDQAAFIGKLGTFYREKAMEFKLPKFYGHPLNCLKLWRSVIRLGGYDRVTGFKLWQQVGDSFNPPKTCTTVSWTFRSFYEKLLLPYERHRTQNVELQLPIAPDSWGVNNERNLYSGSIKHQGQNEVEHPMKAAETETSKP